MRNNRHYTTKAPEYHTTYSDPSYYTEFLKYKFAPSYTTKELEYNIEAPEYYTTTYAAPA